MSKRQEIELLVFGNRVRKLLERITVKVNKSIAEDPHSEIEFNIPNFVKSTLKNIHQEIEDEILLSELEKIDNDIEKENKEIEEIQEKKEKESEKKEKESEKKNEKNAGSSRISTSPLPPDFDESDPPQFLESDPIKFAKSFLLKGKKMEKKEKKEKMEKKEIQVIGTVYKKKDQEGDFEWHITSGKYEDSLFLFNEDEKRCKWKRAGAGSAVIRKYNKYAIPDRPRSCGIITGKEEGYSILNDNAKKMIDASIEEAREIIKKCGYKKIYYSSSTPNGMIGTSLFKVGDEVIAYITEKIKSLEN